MLYNNIDMSDYMRIIDVRGRGITEQELTTVRVVGSDDDYVTYRTKPPRYLEIDYEIRAKDKEELRKKIDAVSAIIETTEKVPIIFPDEPDMTYYGEYAGVEESVEYHHVGIHRGTIYILRDKYKYGPEKVYQTDQDTFIIENEGTAPTKPIFELTCKQPVTFAMVSDGERYNMIGRPADVDVDVVNERILKLEERGETLNEWTTSGARVDGTVSGQFGTDGTGIIVLNYGTGPRWHGPALIREIDPIQDFEIEMQCRVDTSQPNQTFRIEFYLFDEYMNDIGKMAVMDSSDKLIFFVAEGRYGPFIAPHVNYAISSRNYQIRDRHFHGMLRMKRIGQRFEFYVARMGSGETPRHFDTLTQVFNDVNNEYQGKLRYVLIHIGKFSGTGSPNVPRINSFKVYEHIQVNEDQTPYIAYSGDVITFDHTTSELLLNGEDAKRLKDFGGEYFTLPRGFTTLTVLPENAFDTKIRFKPRYR